MVFGVKYAARLQYLRRALIVSVCALMFLGAPRLAGAIELQPGQGVSFAQINFGFPAFSSAQQIDSSWGEMVVGTKQLLAATGSDRGYLNVYTNAGWTVQNLRVNARADSDWLTTYFDLQVTPGTDVTSLSARVAFSITPEVAFPDGVRNSFVVSARDENARGPLEPSVVGVPAVVASGSFTSGAKSSEFFNSAQQIVDEDNNQAFAGAFAEGLESFKERRGMSLPNPLRASSGGRIGALWRYCSLPAAYESEGVLASALKYAAFANIQGQVSFTHQGYVTHSSAVAYTLNGVTSLDNSVARYPTFEYICDRVAEMDSVVLRLDWSGAGQRTTFARAVSCGRTLGQAWIKASRDQFQGGTATDGSDRNVLFFHVKEPSLAPPQISWGGPAGTEGLITHIYSTHYDIGQSAPNSILWETGAATASGSFGTAVAAIGDITGDGISDYIAGAPYDASGGSVRVVSGASGAVLTTLQALTAGERFGQALAGVGDINGDTVPDFAVGAYRWNTSRGAVRVYSGATFGLLYTFSGTINNDYFGSSVAGGEDVNGDGVPDIVVGAPQTLTAVGFIEVYSGQSGALLFHIAGPVASSRLGQAVALLPDLDADNHAEIAAGAWNMNIGGTTSGSVFVYSGANASQLYTANGGAGFRMGFAIAQAGDVNRDGFADLIVGIPGASTSGANSGGARIFSGANFNILYNLYGTTANSYLGEAVAGDFFYNHDRYPDVAVGAALAPSGTGFGSAGNVLFYSGRTGNLLGTALGSNAAGFLGTAVASLGDINNDGLADFAFGVPGAPAGGKVGVYSGENLTNMGYGCSASGRTPRIVSRRQNVLPGSVLDIEGFNAQPNAVVIISYGLATQSLAPLPGGCSSMIDLATLNLNTTVLSDQFGDFNATLTMPTGSTTTFARLAVQAAVFPSPLPLGVDLSNTLLLTIK